MKKLYLSFFSALLALSSIAQQHRTTATVVLTPSKDNTIYENNTGNSNGAGPYFTAGKTGGSGGESVRRALLRFDLSSIPAGSTITAVSLQLTVNRVGNSTAAPFNLHRVTADWGEGTSNAGAGGDGNGAAATTGDATWINRMHPGTAWSSQGGDFSATISASQNVGGVTNYTWTGSQMLADVQSWYTTPSGNFGWLLKSNEVASGLAKRFVSRNNASATQRPQLTVTYSSTAPVTLSVFKGNEVSNGVLLSWQTQSEFNNKYFDVEHSLNGNNFDVIGKLNGAGTTTASTDYKLVHQGVLPGKHFYRLAQYDLDGKVNYSQVIQVNVRSKHRSILISPNPVSDIINLQGLAIVEGMEYNIINAAGSKVSSGKLNSTQINVSQLASGFYSLNITDGKEMFSGRFLIK